MRIAVLGTGAVGHAIATKLVALGHDVTMGSRTAGNDKATAWVASAPAGGTAAAGTFADAAGGADLVVNATSGEGSLDALAAAGAANLAGKVLIDVSNPLDFSHGMPPTLSVANTTSLSEQIQAAFPDARVVKSLNTMNCDVMVDPSLVPGSHMVMVCGNDAGAKAEAARLLHSFGWPPAAVVDLGDLSAARGMEMYVILWVRLFAAVGHPHFNIALCSGSA